MARKPREEGARSKKGGNRGASGRRSAPKRPQKPARKSPAKPAKAIKSDRRVSAGAATLKRELSEARARQAATAEILKIVASSPDNVQPVFEAIVVACARLFGCDRSFIHRCDGVNFWAVAAADLNGPQKVLDLPFQPIDPDGHFPSRAVVSLKTLYLPDWTAIDLPAREREMRRKVGINSALYLPLVREGHCIGVLGLVSKRTNNFGDDDIALAESFRDQALIAIENAWLFNETKEALERQTATAEILKVIAGSPSDVQPVFEAIAASANRLLGGHSTAVIRVIDGVLHLAAFTRVNAEADAVLTSMFPMPASTLPFFERLVGGEPYQEPDMETLAAELPKQIARARGYRSSLFVPLMNAGRTIGLVGVTRVTPGMFASEEVHLLQTFASQAVIAIENARLFNETKEALARQTATANILKVISSSIADAKPVFDEILHSVEHLFGAEGRAILLKGPDGLLHVGAFHGPNAEEAPALFPVPIKGTAAEIAFDTRSLVTFADVLNDGRAPEGLRALARRFGQTYSIAVAPMLAEDRAIGVLLANRMPVKAFSEKECALLQTLADQAVIAIENTRLFNETREALARQTATADVLKVIASSPSNLQPVFDAIALRSKELIGGHATTVGRHVDGMIHLASFTPVDPEADAILRAMFPHSPHVGDPQIAQVLRGEIARITEAQTEIQDSAMRATALARGWRSRLIVPLKDDVAVIGWISVTRKEAGEFADKDVELLRTFADQAVIAIQNVELFEEVQVRTADLQESLQQQTATADALKVISRSAFDLDSVMDTLASSARDLCEAEAATLFLRDGDTLVSRGVAAYENKEAWRGNPIPINEESHMGRAVLTGTVANIGDFENDPNTKLRKFQQALGFKAFLAVPLMREGRGVGVFILTRFVVGEFTPRQIELVQTFADQAVIAIENTRLFNETREALARQTATADVLKVIASSPSNLQPVFDAIAARSKELVAGHSTTVFRFAGDIVELVGATSVGAEADAVLRATFPMPVSRMRNIEKILRGETSEIVDVLADTQPDDSSKEVARARGWRSRLVVPLKGDNAVIGFISITRKEPGTFADKDKELVRTFADQAVIAIQNVELFEEVQARTRDLQESLQQQTATSEVLEVISSSMGDVQPVFEKMLESAARVCGAQFGAMGLYTGEAYRRVAVYNVPAAFDVAAPREFSPAPEGPIGRVLRTGQVARIDDLRQSPAYLARNPVMVAMVELAEARTLVVVPLLKDARPIGQISIYRKEIRPFTDKEVDLLKNFANQAVIAIENTRLFNETREALARQTATSDVLKVIASSPSNLQPVFDTIAQRSKELIGAHSTTVVRYIGGLIELASFTPVSAEADAALRAMFPREPDTDDPQVQQILRGEIAQIADAESEILHPVMREVARARGWRSRLLVALKDDTGVIGWISITRKEAGAFAEKDVELLQTFADQAVIAISNVELFQEVQARTRDLQESLQQQTATADVLKVISRSAFDLQAVLDTLVESAYKLCGASLGLLYLRDEEAFECKAIAGVGVEEADQMFKGRPIRAGRRTAAERVILTGEVHAITDFFTDPEFDPAVRDRIRSDPSESGISKLRSTLAVPMTRENEVVGVLVIARPQTGTFPQRQVELLQTFADQAVIAISNAELFRQVQERTRELSQSLDDLRAAQDRLVQTEKLASLGQLTAGIAHEIKNPLNFVNNFSALSVELTDELNDVLKQAELAEKIQEDVGEITQLLKSNLEKVVQHGKRADSIVKNMLLHSREGSGEQRAADINSLVEESLNLAYHGARAEKSGFNITLEREFDASAGSAELFPQEMTRALLNLISNGFYAATRRKVENGEAAFEPTLLATTRDRGAAVEIRIRDNGTGIPPEVKEKMFNPFFTTKPAGEGTGLGLSMTHDIIVKQHGGTIDVATEPGSFTEFIVVLPRANNAHGKSKDRA